METGVTSVTGCAPTKGSRSCFILQTADYTVTSPCPSAQGPLGTPLPSPGLGSKEQAPPRQAKSKGVWNSLSLDLSDSGGPSMTNHRQETTKVCVDCVLCRPLLLCPELEAGLLESSREGKDESCSKVIGLLGEVKASVGGNHPVSWSPSGCRNITITYFNGIMKLF